MTTLEGIAFPHPTKTEIVEKAKEKEIVKKKINKVFKATEVEKMKEALKITQNLSTGYEVKIQTLGNELIAISMILLDDSMQATESVIADVFPTTNTFAMNEFLTSFGSLNREITYQALSKELVAIKFAPKKPEKK